MTDEQLRARTQELREALTAKKLRPGDVMPEAFAIIRESMDRHIGIREIFNPEQNFDPDQLDDEHLGLYDEVQQADDRQRRVVADGADPAQALRAVRKLHPESRPPFRARPFDVQLIGGLVPVGGADRGDGHRRGQDVRRAAGVLPARAGRGLHCHVVTVNDYLVRRDASGCAQRSRPGVERRLHPGRHGSGSDSRRTQYGADITYGTNSEFGFDYLRDKHEGARRAAGAGSARLRDRGRGGFDPDRRGRAQPLIISGAAHDDAPKYKRADEVARKVIELK
jgi:preprotein translocase subunit SecA